MPCIESRSQRRAAARRRAGGGAARARASPPAPAVGPRRRARRRRRAPRRPRRRRRRRRSPPPPAPRRARRRCRRRRPCATGPRCASRRPSAWSPPTPTSPTSARVPDQLLAIPVLEIELNGDGSVRRIEVLREPRAGQGHAEDRRRGGAPRGAVRRRLAPAEALEVRRDLPLRRRPQVQAAHARPLRRATADAAVAGLRHNPAMFFNLPTLLTWARIVAIPLSSACYYLPLAEPRRRTSSPRCCSSCSRSPTGPTATWRAG